MPQPIFITGDGTDVGKTLVTAALARRYARNGAVTAIKPVQSGCRRDETGRLLAPDEETYRHALRPFPERASATSLVKLEPACSPHLAAETTGAPLDFDDLVARLRAALPDEGVALVEGAGGLLVPLTRERDMADLALAIGATLVVVVANRLGALNGALLTFEAARRRSLRVAGVALVEVTPPADDLDRRIRQDNKRTIAERADAPVIAELPFLPDYDPTSETTWARLDAACRWESELRLPQ